MWLVATLILIVGASIGAIGLGFVPPPGAHTLIQVKAGVVLLTRGSVHSRIMADIGEVLARAGVSSGFIAISSENRIAFSRRIPPAMRQQLRNILLN